MLTTFVRLLTGITFVTLSLAGATAPLDKNADSEQKARVFHLNVSPNGYPPYLIVRDNDYSGILWDVMTLVTEKMNFRIEAVKIPRKRVDQMIQDGYMDGTLRARAWTPDPEQFAWSNVIVHAEEVFFYLAGESLCRAF